MELELISFKLCPFVQSTVITLLQHNVDYKITYIDINDPPPWFEDVSPTGQVPILMNMSFSNQPLSMSS
jgi:glutathione S-transferase